MLGQAHTDADGVTCRRDYLKRDLFFPNPRRTVAVRPVRNPGTTASPQRSGLSGEPQVGVHLLL